MSPVRIGGEPAFPIGSLLTLPPTVPCSTCTHPLSDHQNVLGGMLLGGCRHVDHASLIDSYMCECRAFTLPRVDPPRDEATAPIGVDSARARRWEWCRRQFDLVRARDGVTYLTRWWIIKTPLGGVALHRMQGPDARDTLHDHPWTFLSVVLRGGYTERRLRPGDMTVDEQHIVTRCNLVRAGVDAHSIRALHRTPTWTLLIVGPVRRTWGFLEHITDISAWPHRPAEQHWRWTRHDAYDSGHYIPGKDA